MIRMPNLTEDFKALESGVFFTDDNICLLGNVAGFFTDINNNIYTNKKGKLFFEGLVYRLQSGKSTVIIAESDVIQEYRNLFNYMFETTQYSNNRYNFPQKYAETITFVDVGLGNDCWTNNKTNIFSRYINYTRDSHMKFDHIIANPPYEFGNAITTTVLSNVDFDDYVNLMPVSKYKKDKIYQHIVPNSLVRVKWEGDAATNPQIAELTKKANSEITEVDFNTWCYDERFKKFYVENIKRSRTFTFVSENLKLKYAGSISPKTCFIVGKRVLTDGVHTTEDCFDYKWNIQKQIIPLCYGDSSDPEDNLRVFIFKFSTEVEMNNFTKFWYSKGKEGLSNLLLKGLGKQTGNPEYAIPRVDWTREWTDEGILKDYGYTDEEIKELLK